VSSPVEKEERREVILSAGTFNSPQLLLLSGIGPAEQLAAQGIRQALLRGGRLMQTLMAAAPWVNMPCRNRAQPER